MKKYNLNHPELVQLSKLVWDIEINFWGDKKYPESTDFKERFDAIFKQDLSHEQIVKLSCKEFDQYIASLKTNK